MLARLSCLKSQCWLWFVIASVTDEHKQLRHHRCTQKTSPETPVLSGHTYRSNEGTEPRIPAIPSPHSPRRQPSLSCTGPRYLLLTFLSWLPSFSLSMPALQPFDCSLIYTGNGKVVGGALHLASLLISGFG